ncbi:MAG: ATP-binding protein [Hydrogenothermus sp.]|nr:MAG: ATP-binding protein [Hydrogenothermus sp.]
MDEKLLNEVLIKINRVLDRFLNEEKQKTDFSKDFAFIYHKNNLKPVKNFDYKPLNSLIGIDYQKEELLKNTKKFVEGKPANNAILWGERGTGKSTLVKSVCYHFKDKGLKIIQVLKEDILSIFNLYELIETNKNYKFVIFIDDLSFQPEEKEYKEFKTIIDGTIYEIPENLLFYITSNRKNLIPIKFSDREKDEETRISDALEEKLSLIDRFGLRLGFYEMDKNTYLKIVEFYAKKYEIEMETQKLHLLAMRYAREMGALNARIALQFIKSL